MAYDTDTLQRLALLEQRLAAVEAAAANIPPAVADSGQAVTVFASYAGTLGDAVKLVSGTWSALIASDVVAGPIGVVIQISSGWAEIQIAGPRVASGTAGNTYFAPLTAGAPTATDPGGGDPPYSIPIERQVAPHLRHVGGMGGGGGGGGGSIVITLPAWGGAAGDVLKCVSGTWSYLTDEDAGAFLVGLILAIGPDPFDATVLVYGTGALAGTQGTVYYAPATAGAMTATRPTPADPPTESPWERTVAVQLTDTLVQVLQIPAVRLLKVLDCDESPGTHYLAETTV